MESQLGFDELVNGKDALRLVFRLLLASGFAFIVIQRVYAKRFYRPEHLFSLWMFSIVTFCIAFLLRKVPMELGFALGLFAVFGVLRYRTETIAVTDLTYLFVVIGLALVNALANNSISLVELLIVDSAIVGTTWVIDGPQRRHDHQAVVLFDRLDLLAPERRPELLQELDRRISVRATRVVIQEVDLLRETARLVVFYAPPSRTD